METVTLSMIISQNKNSQCQVNEISNKVPQKEEVNGNDVVIINVNDETEDENEDSSSTSVSTLSRGDHQNRQKEEIAITCKICLNKFTNTRTGEDFDDFYDDQIYEIESCKCKFCIECLKQYVKQCIENCDVCPINCPDSKCKTEGSLSQQEVKHLIFSNAASKTTTLDHNNNEEEIVVNPKETEKIALVVLKDCIDDCTDDDDDDKQLMRLYKQYLYIYESSEILRDPTRVHCPRPDCNNVCSLDIADIKQQKRTSYKVTCDKCDFVFCSVCFKTWKKSDKDDDNDMKSEGSPPPTPPTKSCKYKKLLKESILNPRKHHLYHHPSHFFSEETECSCHNGYSKEKIKQPKKTKSSTSKPPNNDSKNSTLSSSISSLSTLSSSIITTSNNHLNSLERSNSSNTVVNMDLANIKRCPNCSILIERADGCAQIMCKACKHTFCFYCLTSLDDDFLLKHFTKNGPCKGKLGHSSFSLLMHRAGVVAIFCGTVLFVLLVSPLVIISLPCLVLSSKCRKLCVSLLPKTKSNKNTSTTT